MSVAGARAGVDLRAEGSGNPGATNVGRVLGKRVGRTVLVADLAKGAIPAGAALALLVDFAVLPRVEQGYAVALPGEGEHTLTGGPGKRPRTVRVTERSIWVEREGLRGAWVEGASGLWVPDEVGWGFVSRGPLEPGTVLIVA